VPIEDALGLAVHVVLIRSDRCTPTLGRARAPSWRVTVGLSILPLIPDAGRPQHAARLHLLGMPARPCPEEVRCTRRNSAPGSLLLWSPSGGSDRPSDLGSLPPRTRPWCPARSCRRARRYAAFTPQSSP
jgi:hypothetical protein